MLQAGLCHHACALHLSVQCARIVARTLLASSSSHHTTTRVTFHYFATDSKTHAFLLVLQAMASARVSAVKARTPLSNVTNVLDSQVITASVALLALKCSSIATLNSIASCEPTVTHWLLTYMVPAPCCSADCLNRYAHKLPLFHRALAWLWFEFGMRIVLQHGSACFL